MENSGTDESASNWGMDESGKKPDDPKTYNFRSDWVIIVQMLKGRTWQQLPHQHSLKTWGSGPYKWFGRRSLHYVILAQWSSPPLLSAHIVDIVKVKVCQQMHVSFFIPARNVRKFLNHYRGIAVSSVPIRILSALPSKSHRHRRVGVIVLWGKY